MKNLIFPIAIEPGDMRNAFDVVVPDIPGCDSAGETREEAYAHAKEASAVHLETLLDEGLPIAERPALEEHRCKPDYAGFAWGFVATGNIPALEKAGRINVSLPEALVPDIDGYVQARGMSRSAFLALAAEHELADA